MNYIGLSEARNIFVKILTHLLCCSLQIIFRNSICCQQLTAFSITVFSNCVFLFFGMSCNYFSIGINNILGKKGTSINRPL